MFFKQSLLFFATSIFTTLSLAASTQEATETVIRAHKAEQLYPVVSSQIPDLTLSGAYQIQSELIKNHLSDGKKIAGYKAGVTTTAGQKRFGLKEPVSGVLLSSAQWSGTSSYSLKQGNRLMIEIELAFKLSEPVEQPLRSLDEVRAVIDDVAPSIEIPDLGFTGKPTGLDVVANNVANKAFLIGQWTSIPENIDAMTFNLICNGEVINEAQSANTMTGQWQALQWLINQQLKLGNPLKKGHILMTGSLGKLIPAKACNYLAHFDELGTMGFTLIP